MALIPGFSLGGHATHVIQQFTDSQSRARARVIAAGGSEEAAGNCLRGRYNELRNRVIERTDTNYIRNSVMSGATGSVLPLNWESSIPAGLITTISASGVASGYTYIDFKIAGTATTDGTLSLWFEKNTSLPSTSQAFLNDIWVGSAFLNLAAGAVSGIPDISLQLAGVNNAGVVQESFSSSLIGLPSGGFNRFEQTGTIANANTTFTNLRITHTVVNGTLYDYTIRIAAPQLEKGTFFAGGYKASPFILTPGNAIASRITGRPSILIVPQLTRAGFVYPQLPTVSGADFTFTRATTATRVNASGLIESVASGLLRLDYPIGGGCPAALIEPSGTNVAFYSEQFSDAYWNKSAITVSGNFVGITAPDGTQTADKMIPTSASGVAHNINKTGFTSAAYTFSVFAKAGEESVLSLWLRSASVGAVFNLVSGTVVSNTTTSASIQNYGNGWYRCIVYDSTAGTTAHIYSRTGGGFTGNDVDGLYLWGAQMETGAIPTSYIPTTTGSATRAADVCTVSGVSGYIGQTEGTIYAEVDLRNLGYNGAILTLQTDNWITNSIQMQKSLGNQWRFTIRAASTLILNVDVGTITAGIHKIALGYNTATSGTVLAVNGSILTTQTASSIPACNSVVLGSRNETGTFSTHLNDRLRAHAIYPTRLSNDQLANITRLT
jgi:hypothetical protein